MPDFDLLIRGGTVVTAADSFAADVGIRDGKIVLWDPKKNEVLRQEIMHHGADYIPYEGMAVTGFPVMTILRGEIAVDDGKVFAQKGTGQFLKRGISPYATKRNT